MLKVLEDLAGVDAGMTGTFAGASLRAGCPTGPCIAGAAHSGGLPGALPIASQTAKPDRPVDGTTLWQGLIDGDWVIAARHDRDGQRYLTLRRATPGERSRLSLTTREREVLAYARLGYSLKLIGHELRLAPSTVSTHLSKGLRKLGLDSVALLTALCCRS